MDSLDKHLLDSSIASLRSAFNALEEDVRAINDNFDSHTHNEQPTLRDQFAMAALTGFMAVLDERTYDPKREDCKGMTYDQWVDHIAATDAKHLYRMADAMLKARGEGV